MNWKHGTCVLYSFIRHLYRISILDAHMDTEHVVCKQAHSNRGNKCTSPYNKRSFSLGFRQKTALCIYLQLDGNSWDHSKDVFLMHHHNHDP